MQAGTSVNGEEQDLPSCLLPQQRLMVRAGVAILVPEIEADGRRRRSNKIKGAPSPHTAGLSDQAGTASS